jgi:hypothetical protein
LLLVEEAALQPLFGTGRAKTAPVVQDVHAAAVLGNKPFELRIDELCDQPDQSEADVTDGHKERRTWHVRVPEIVPGKRRHSPRNVDPTGFQLAAMVPV